VSVIVGSGLFSTTSVLPTTAGADEFPELDDGLVLLLDEVFVVVAVLLLLVQPEAAIATAPRAAIAVMDLRSISDSMDLVGFEPTIRNTKGLSQTVDRSRCNKTEPRT
jgi:hypothetical protein